LSEVHADLTELLQFAQNIKIAVNSVMATKNSIMQKYQQLGAGWNDKKYKELGDIVQECNKALNNVLKILQQSEKYVSALAKSLQEYENVNIAGEAESDNSFIQRLRNGVSSLAGNERYQYCLGVLTKGNIPSDYMEVIGIRYDNAEPNARRVFDSFADKLMIQNADYPENQTAHYSPMGYPGHSRGVYYNAEADMINLRGAGTTYFHELGHMIDHASTGYQENMSNTVEFGRALIEDGQNVLSTFNNMTSERRSNFLNVIRQDSAHSFSDLIDATTNGLLHGSYGHSRGYWQRRGNLQAEAFAHFFEASMGGGWKLELLSNMFPTAFAIFSEMLESIQPEGRERVLER